MQFITQNQLFILLGTIGVLILGFAVFGVLFYGLKKKVGVLFGGAKNKETDLQRNLIGRTAKTETKLQELEPRLEVVEAISKVSVQKVGFLRFNPFNDTGGDNSFVLVLLDRENNGVLLTSLYMREGVRTYAKKVEGGETRQPLSEEEKRVLDETILQKPQSPNHK